MDNESDISKILITTTSVIASIRFDLEVVDVEQLLLDLKSFYSGEIKDWSYSEFLKIFAENCPKNRGTFEDLKKSEAVFYSYNKIMSTNNISTIINFQDIFLRLFNHALYLNAGERTEQLENFFDTIHGLPEALIRKEKWAPRAFWKTYFVPYCRRWNVDFSKIRKAFFRFPYFK